MAGRDRKRICLLFGGRSTEHRVSLTSAAGILEHIDRDRYEVVPVKVTREGRWEWMASAAAPVTADDLDRGEGIPVMAGPPGYGGFIKQAPDGRFDPALRIPVDVIFPIIHGTFGEDGTLQGLLSMADLPFVGAGVLGSSLGMDKIMMKQILFQENLPAVDFLWFLRSRWETHPDAVLEGVRREIGFPCFVKPANSGSSVGVHKAHDAGELRDKISDAARYDRKILVEKAVDARELECAVLGNDDPEASAVGEIVPANEFYDYEAKYEDEKSITLIPADLPEPVTHEIRRLAVATFKALDCAGMGRVDFLMERRTERLYINEINTLPGFTPISMYPKLWESGGLPLPELISRLIVLAEERFEDLRKSEYHRNR